MLLRPLSLPLLSRVPLLLPELLLLLPPPMVKGDDGRLPLEVEPPGLLDVLAGVAAARARLLAS